MDDASSSSRSRSRSRSRSDSKWYDQITLDPAHRLMLTAHDRSKIHISNRSGRRISYKVKTTRYYSVMPNRTYGMIEPYESKCIKIAYKPRPQEKPFRKSDRVTLLMKAVLDPESKPDLVWKEKAHRHRLRLCHNPSDKQFKTSSSRSKRKSSKSRRRRRRSQKRKPRSSAKRN